MKMKMTGNFVLVEPLPLETKSSGGLHLPTDPKYFDDQKQWRVLAVGPGKLRKKKGRAPLLIPPEVAPGDRVLVDIGQGWRMAFEDGSNRRVIDADIILMKW
jgi:co-chaperonin GroES (HSP10)